MTRTETKYLFLKITNTRRSDYHLSHQYNDQRSDFRRDEYRKLLLFSEGRNRRERERLKHGLVRVMLTSATLFLPSPAYRIRAVKQDLVGQRQYLFQRLPKQVHPQGLMLRSHLNHLQKSHISHPHPNQSHQCHPLPRLVLLVQRC